MTVLGRTVPGPPHPVPLRSLGVPDVFAPTGSAEWLLDHFDMAPAGIARAATDLVQRRPSA